MGVEISCKCGWHSERRVASRTEAEVIADVHEAQGARRAYRHDTTIEEVRGWRESGRA